MSFLVLGPAHTSDRNAWAGLRDTCELFGVPLKVIGMDKPMSYPSNDPRLFLESLPGTLAELEASTADYVVITDTFDVLACRKWDGDYVASIIEAQPGKLLVSCEANCFPDGPWRQHYDGLSTSPWRYPNAGQFCGTRGAVIEFLSSAEAFVRIQPLDNPFVGATQEALHRMAMHDYPMGLDCKCRVFQSMYTNWAWIVGTTERPAAPPIVKNWCTNEEPFFLHFNGRAPNMHVWYKTITGRSMPPSSVRPEYA